ncbi:MAG: hypothetical protein P8078_00585 [bacterium]
MKPIILFLSIIVFWYNAAAQNFRATVKSQVKQQKLSQTDALFLQAVAMFAPEQLPPEYKSLNFEVQKCGFGLMAQINSNFVKFSTSQQASLQEFLDRPDLPFSIISPSSLFKIHYTITGSEAVPLEDADESGIPDYVEEVARTMDYNYQIEVLNIGLNEPPSDDIDGPEWDVYIKNIPNYFGYTSFDTKISTNPNVWTSHMIIDNDYVHTQTTLLDGMRITTAHEFFHMIQLGYNFRNKDIFLMEVGSTWIEDVLYDEVNQYIEYLPAFLSSTNTAFDTFDGYHEYGLCLWFHFLQKRLHSIYFVTDIWEYITNYPAIQAVNQVLIDKGSNFDKELTLFYGWNYLTGSRADTLSYYPEGNTYPEISDSDLDGIYNFSHDTTIAGSVVSTGAKYFKFNIVNGSSFILIPVNINTTAEGDQLFTFNLKKEKDNTDQFYLSPGVYINLSSEQNNSFKGTAIMQTSDNTNILTYLNYPPPELISLSPSYAQQGENLLINITGSHTHFSTGSQTVYFTRDSSILYLSIDSVYSDSVLAASVFLPLQAEAGFWDASVQNELDGIMTLEDGFHIIIKSEEIKLPECYPNPFIINKHDYVIIPFEIKQPDQVEIKIYTPSGYLVWEDKISSLESIVFKWDGRNIQGGKVAGGIYIYSIHSESKVLRQGKIAVIN